jgi:hypothetical protein
MVCPEGLALSTVFPINVVDCPKGLSRKIVVPELLANVLLLIDISQMLEMAPPGESSLMVLLLTVRCEE